MGKKKLSFLSHQICKVKTINLNAGIGTVKEHSSNPNGRVNRYKLCGNQFGNKHQKHSQHSYPGNTISHNKCNGSNPNTFVHKDISILGDN